MGKQARKDFAASKFDVGNWKIHKCESFGNSLGTLLNMEGINLFAKNLVFVKICLKAKGRRKDKKFRSLEVREASLLHLKKDQIHTINFFQSD